VGEVVAPEEAEEPVMIQRANGETVPLQPGGFDHFADSPPGQ